MPAGPLRAQKKAFGPAPSPHSSRVTYTDLQLSAPFPESHQFGSSIRMLNLGEAISLVRGPSLRKEGPPQRVLLLQCLQFSGRIPAIHEFSYAARSSPRSKRYNVTASMWAIMDSGGYLCMTIFTIKRRNLGGYKEIPMCRSCSCWDPKYPAYINS